MLAFLAAVLARSDTPSVPIAQHEATLEAWGASVIEQADLVGAELSDAELRLFDRGLTTQLEGQPARCDLEKASSDIEKLARNRLEKVTAARINHRLKEAGERFAKLASTPGARRLPSGAVIEIIDSGHGVPAKPRQTAVVGYTGRLLDGTEFVRMEPFPLILVPNRVARPLFDGIQQLAPGGKARLHVPPKLLGADEARFGVPDSAASVFEIEVLEVKPTAEEDLANSLLPAAPEPPPAPPSGYPLATLLPAWGWTVARQTSASSFALTEREVAAFIRGVNRALRGTPSDQPPPVPPEVSQFVAAGRERIRKERRQRQLDAMDRFFADLKKKSGVIEEPNGLRFEVLEPGAGIRPKLHDVVIVDYTGRLIDGTVFDRTDNEPLHVEVGSVIDGWNQGIQKIAAGGRIRLYIPPSLGYGDEDTSGVLTRIPANSTLVYDIRLLAIEPAGGGGSASAAAPASGLPSER